MYMRKCWMMLGFAMLCILLSACNSTGLAKGDEEGSIRIGYQKNGPLIIMKSLGNLEERLSELGYDVEWKEFQAGPALVEALNAGSIDFGRTGNSPIIFAQAADTPFEIVAVGKSKMEGSGILVPEDTDIASIADLKNKTVSFAKGSSSHYLLVKALEKAGLEYSDIKPAFLSPGDARVAFEQGKVDAMVVWDPFTASTQLDTSAVLLQNGEGLTEDRDFFIANTTFAEAHEDILEIIIEELEKSSEWANNNHDELVKMLAPILSIDEAAVKLSVERRVFGIDPMTEEIMTEQQEIADTFYRLDIIPKEIDVRKVMEE